jgi:hypothetical protein
MAAGSLTGFAGRLRAGNQGGPIGRRRPSDAPTKKGPSEERGELESLDAPSAAETKSSAGDK